jgi:eukaryotic-like serine/threonine-protein kinase
MMQCAKDEKAIFLAALEQASPAERQAYLQGACGDDPALLKRLRVLLSVHEQSQGPLDAPSPVVALAPTVDDPIRERPGTVIGPYKLLEEIGEGGMGLVFVAEQQQPVHRKVALKVIKPGMDSRQVIARFEAERQALAMMDHPNIAKVHDGGTTAEGRPYFVMEWVKGTPITDYCDRHRLTNRQRLQLFLDVCQAVQHAHQKGIIHRDLKPSNILVSLHDVTPVVKVIDFGIAKATSGRLADRTVYTELAQMVGTPMYMSPEQAGLSDIDVDTRSDVYSLGVLLYELLTGTTPFDREQLKELSYDEIRRIIREDEPPRPSKRLSTIEQAALSTIAERHGLEPHRLSQQVRGELDWIVMKALEKDRNRRYESASSLAADVQRYLDDEPVQACPPSAVYRLRKLARRHKLTLGTAGLVALTVLAVAASAGYVLRDRSTRQAVVAARVSDALDESERLYHAGKVPEALNAAQRAESLLATGPLDEVLATRVQERVEDLQMVLKLEEVGVATQGKRSAEYEQLFRRYGIDLAAQPAEEIAARVRSRLIASDLVATLDQLAVRFFSLGHHPGDNSSPWKLELMAVTRQIDPDPWRDRVRQAIERGDKAALQDLARTAPIDQLPPVTLRIIAIGLGKFTLEERERASEGHPLLSNPLNLTPEEERILASEGHPLPKTRARDFLRRAVQRYPSDLWLNWLLADDFQYGVPRDEKEAAGYYRTLVALRPNSAEVYFRLGQMLQNSQQWDDAIPYFRRAVEIDPQFLPGYQLLAASLKAQGRLDEAIAASREAIPYYEDVAMGHNDVGVGLAIMGRLDEAVAELREAIRLKKNYASPHNNLGNVLAIKGRLDEAIAAYREAIRLDKDDAKVHLNLGNKLWIKGRLDEAIAAYREAIRLKPDSAGNRNELAWRLATCPDLKLRDPGQAVAHAKKAVELAPSYGGAWNTLGVAQYRNGEWKAAVEALMKSVQLQKEGDSFDFFFLATAHWQLGEKDKARAWYEKAVAWMDKHKPNDEELKRFRAEATALLGMERAVQTQKK